MARVLNAEQPSLVGVEDAARLLSVGRSTTYELLCTGALRSNRYRSAPTHPKTRDLRMPSRPCQTRPRLDDDKPSAASSTPPGAPLSNPAESSQTRTWTP